VRIAYHVAQSPLGLLFLARSERGLRHLEFLDRRSVKRAIAAHAARRPGDTWEPSLYDLRDVAEQLEGYFSGTVQRFHVPLDPLGSEFQLQVWRALLEIPYGETRTYGQIAERIGQPGAARAVGLANHDNPIAIVVPCHRVVGAGGKLVGYGGGLPRKKKLLELEAHFGRIAGHTGDLFDLPIVRRPKTEPAARAGAARSRATADVARSRATADSAAAASSPARRARPGASAAAPAPPARRARRTARGM
jgi:methylated-DNA-[protein]-cysteine S-methyltransferase